MGEPNSRKLLMNLKGGYQNLQAYLFLIMGIEIHLYPESTKFATGSALYQIKN